ncbi:hypothetical protein L198_02557 [Cryptococcus wingfieldii CBS 7118]|uniref:Uncharacterized protein n=1 Tax=Cryptococcus wingfieldii CBS 7118 TaxID=1295528 RepID=A0A1E3JLV2_9TREE|nr:hypothetical protein L198_02557 [Cryptococcus wingfieldii CBS 7118]ODO01830.1 hypothetical protein L198_02557 [Cryptococcus wingfieldii CBS 7118]
MPPRYPHSNPPPPPYSLLPTSQSPSPPYSPSSLIPLTPLPSQTSPTHQRILHRAFQDFHRSANPSHWGLYRHGLRIHIIEKEEGWGMWVLRVFGEAMAPGFDGPVGTGVGYGRAGVGGGMGVPFGMYS